MYLERDRACFVERGALPLDKNVKVMDPVMPSEKVAFASSFM